MSQVEHETRRIVDDVYPERAGSQEPEPHAPDPPLEAVGLPSARSGYLQAVDPAPLVGAAVRHDLVIRLTKRVGDHVVVGTPIAWAWRRAGDQPPPPAGELQAAVGDAVQIGFERTMVQDVGFGIRRLVDVANKALSPAVNDPYTGVQAVHQISVLLTVLAGARLGDWLVHDRQGVLRVAVPRPSFADYLRLGTAQIRRYGASEPAVTRSLIQLLRDVGIWAAAEDRRQACAHHLRLVLEDAKRETAQPADLQAVLEDGAAALSALGADHPQTTSG